MIKWLIKTLQKFDNKIENSVEDNTHRGPLPTMQTVPPVPNKVEPHIDITGFAINPNNPSEGAFEFDWNDEFIKKLIYEGYTGKSDEDLVEQWFADICRNVVLETYEQERARIGRLPDFDDMNYETPRFTQKRRLDDGRTEFE